MTPCQSSLIQELLEGFQGISKFWNIPLASGMFHKVTSPILEPQIQPSFGVTGGHKHDRTAKSGMLQMKKTWSTTMNKRLGRHDQLWIDCNCEVGKVEEEAARISLIGVARENELQQDKNKSRNREYPVKNKTEEHVKSDYKFMLVIRWQPIFFCIWGLFIGLCPKPASSQVRKLSSCLSIMSF